MVGKMDLNWLLINTVMYWQNFKFSDWHSLLW